MRLALYAFSICLLGLVLGANVPDIGLDDMPLRAGLSNDILGRAASTGGIWDGNDFAVVISLDDALDGQADYMTMLASYGIRPTLFLKEENIDAAGGLTTAQIAAIIAADQAEIGSTGRYSRTGGLLGLSVEADIINETSPAWIDSAFGVTPVSYGVDAGPMSYQCAEIIADHGYTSWRGTYFQHGNGGWVPGYPGSGRWEPVRAPDPTSEFNLYGYGEFIAEATGDALTNYGLFDGAAITDRDSVEARAARNIFAVSEANGNCPIVLTFHDLVYRVTDLPYFIEYCQARGDVAFMTAAEMAAVVRSQMVPIDAPGWAPYAKLEGITASDSMFWGQPAADYSETVANTYAFHNSSTAAAIPAGATDLVTGHAQALLHSGDPDYVVGSPTTGYMATILEWSNLPGDGTGTGRIGALYFNCADTLSGREIVSATLGFYSYSGADWSAYANDHRFYAVIGVDSPSLFNGWSDGDNDLSFFYYDTSDSTNARWTDVGPGLYDYYINTASTEGYTGYQNTNYFGTHIYPWDDLSVIGDADMLEADVTDYVREVVADNLPGALFFFTGMYLDGGTAVWYQRLHTYATTSVRPYLVVETAD